MTSNMFSRRKSLKVRRSYKWVERAVVISAMRRIFRRYPAYKVCLDAAKSEYFIKSKTGKPMRRVQWECASCKNKVNNLNKVIDHINPVIDPIIGFVDYDTYAERLFCDILNLQVLCKTCHNVKSKAENKERRKTKK